MKELTATEFFVKNCNASNENVFDEMYSGSDVIEIMVKYRDYLSSEIKEALECPHCNYIGKDFKPHDFTIHETKVAEQQEPKEEIVKWWICDECSLQEQSNNMPDFCEQCNSQEFSPVDPNTKQD